MTTDTSNFFAFIPPMAYEFHDKRKWDLKEYIIKKNLKEGSSRAKILYITQTDTPEGRK